MFLNFHQRNSAREAKARHIPQTAGFFPVNGRMLPVNDLKLCTLFFGFRPPIE